MVLQPSGFIVVCESRKTNVANGISGGVSAPVSGTNAELWVLNPITCKAVYDVIPALEWQSSRYLGCDAMRGWPAPCGPDGHHHFFRDPPPTGTSYCSLPSGATEIAVGPWTSGPELMVDSGNLTSSTSIPLGSSTVQNFQALTQQTSSIVGMLESDLQHFGLFAQAVNGTC